MKYYVVEAPYYDGEKIFIVKSDNKKMAIELVFNQYFKWRNTQKLKQDGYEFYRKSDFTATELEAKIAEGSNNIVCLC